MLKKNPISEQIFDLNNEIDRLMAPKGKKELEALKSSTFRQFLIRYLDLRDSVISLRLAEAIEPMLEVLEKLSDGQKQIASDTGEIKLRLEAIEKKQIQDEIEIEKLKVLHELPKTFDDRLKKVEAIIPVVHDLKEYASPKWTGIRWAILAIIITLSVLVLSEQFPEFIHKIFGR